MILRRFRNSIVTHILLLGLSLVVFGVVVRYHALSGFLREDLGSLVENQQLALATYVAHDIDYKIVQRQTLLERLAESLPLDLLDQPGPLRAWLKERYDYQPLFSVGLFVVDTQGRVVGDYPPLPDRADKHCADRDYVQAGLAGRPLIGRAIVGRIAKEPVLPISVPIKDAGGRIRGVLVGTTALAAPDFLDALLQSRIGKATGGFLLVSPRDKLFIASSQAEMILQPTPPPGLNALHDRAMNGFRGTGMTTNAKGVEEISAIAPVPSAGWFVVARLPTDEAFSTVGRMQQFMVKNAVVTIAVFALLSSIGLYFVLRPLFSAAEHADSMTLGERPLEPLPVVRNDEIGHIISAFNRLLVKLNEKQAELARIAHHDMLTGLPNRVLLSDRLNQLLAQARRKETQVGLLFMDLDGFKQINDSLGHEAGDEALRQVAQRLSRIVRQADTLARVGGDEFVLMLSDLGDDAEEAAGIVATKCIDALDAPFPIGGTACDLGVSIGVALGRGDSTPDNLLLSADRAMYQAKGAGRGRFVIGRI